MALTPRLEVRQSQSLSLTPQLMQSIRLLQLSHLEINAFVEEELLRNPLLEREDEGGDGEGPTQMPEVTPGDLTDLVGNSGRLDSAETIAEGYDTSVENLFPEQSAADGPSLGGSWDGGGGSGAGGDAPDIDQYVAGRTSLADHLAGQIGVILANPAERLIGRALIDSLDEAGYLYADLAALAEQLGTTVECIEAVLKQVQRCDPAGVFAQSLTECLGLQLREQDRLDPLMARLLANLDMLAAHDLGGLQRAVGCDREDLLDMIAELKRLDPRPGRAFDGATIEAVVPDVFVRAGHGGDWLIELNGEILPRVLVNRTYYSTVSRGTRTPGEKTFLTECLNTASWLAKSLDQRAQTILKVSTEIVRQQDGFLRHGVAYLKPMTLKMVADAIGMHESTVSRVTSAKYLSTPRGLFELKYFFTTALSSSTGGEEHSAEAVRHRIRQLIEAEPASAILSDDTIAAILKREAGIDVARRTVAKYREGMNIPSSVLRRRQKQALAGAR